MTFSSTRRHNQNGYSLVELVISIAVISFGLVSIIGLMPIALDSAKQSRNETRLAHIVQNIYSDLQMRRGILSGPSWSQDWLEKDEIFPTSQPVLVYYNYNGEIVNQNSEEREKYYTVEIKITEAPFSLAGGVQIETGYLVDVFIRWPGNGQTAISWVMSEQS